MATTSCPTRRLAELPKRGVGERRPGGAHDREIGRVVDADDSRRDVVPSVKLTLELLRARTTCAFVST